MYQTLYRKYRPSTFDKVVGQDVIVRTLKNAIIKDKISHAYLFEGPRGTGKTSIAKIFAKTVNCENPNNGIPCNKCKSCLQINMGNNMDIIEMDAASSNSVEDIRNLISKTNVIPYNSKYKIYIIDEVHMLSQGAENALLKTLEEPPKHVIFILATTDPQKLLSTIISRCQVFEFKKISDEHIKNNLKYICDEEKININNEALYTIARLASGGMRDAISILDQVIAFKEDNITAKDVHDVNGTITNEELKFFIHSIFDNNVEHIYQKLDEYENNGINLLKLLDEIVVFLNNILIVKYAKEYATKTSINIDLYKEFEDIPKDILSDYILSFNECINQMKISSNPKLIMELELIKNMKIDAKPQIKEVKDEIKKEIKEETNDSKPITNNELLDKLIDIRTNNTLYYINKKEMIDTKNIISGLKNHLFDEKYGKLAELILDGSIKAAGNNYVIFVYDNETDSKLLNDNILKLEEMFKNLLDLSIKPVGLSSSQWEPIKVRFNNKEKFQLMEDNIDLNNIFNNEEDQIKKVFGHLIKKEG